MKLAFNMESWEACGGGQELSGSDALAEGNRYIDKAIKIFQEVRNFICHPSTLEHQKSKQLNLQTV